MRTLQIALPDVVFAQAEAKAKEEGLDAPMFCATLVADHLLFRNGDRLAKSPTPMAVNSSHDTNSTRVSDSERGRLLEFDVAAQYPHYHRGSIALAQTFIDEALKHGDAEAFKTEKGVGLKPNFAFVEYLGKRSPGICVSLYGNRKEYPKILDLLKNGRTSSHSRAQISNPADLRRLLPLIREAYRLKLG